MFFYLADVSLGSYYDDYYGEDYYQYDDEVVHTLPFENGVQVPA